MFRSMRGFEVVGPSPISLHVARPCVLFCIYLFINIDVREVFVDKVFCVRLERAAPERIWVIQSEGCIVWSPFYLDTPVFFLEKDVKIPSCIHPFRVRLEVFLRVPVFPSSLFIRFFSPIYSSFGSLIFGKAWSRFQNVHGFAWIHDFVFFFLLVAFPFHPSSIPFLSATLRSIFLFTVLLLVPLFVLF